MFNHPGKKLKGLSKFIFALVLILGIVAASIVGGLTKSQGLVIVTVIVGVVLAWLSSVALYAFGAMVADVESIKETLYAMTGRKDPEEQSTPVTEREMPDPSTIDVEAIQREAAQRRAERNE